MILGWSAAKLMPLNLWAPLSEVYEGSNGIRKKAWRARTPAARVCVVLRTGLGGDYPGEGGGA